MRTKIIAASAALVTAGATLVAAPAAEAAGRGAHHLRVTSKHTVGAPATIRPGLARLRNDGSRPIIVFRKKRDGADRLVTYLNAKSEKTGKKAFTRFGFVEILGSRADDFVKLTRGTYYLVDASGRKAKVKGVRTLSVRGKTSNAKRPASTRVLRVSKSGKISGATTASVRPYLRFVNGSSAPRLISGLPIRRDATEAQISDAIAHPTTDKIFDLVDGESGELFSQLAFLGAGRDVTTRTSLRTGRYFVMAASIFSENFFANPRLLRVG